MEPATGHDVTRLLAAWKEGDKDALDALMQVVYDELRRIATAHLRRERPGHTLQPTALIHEAYMRLMQGDKPHCSNRVHFFAVTARIMRRVLIDATRKHRAEKRGQRFRTDLTDNMAAVWQRDVDLLELDAALEGLAKVDERKCRVIEMKYFGGLTREEIAASLGTSDATVGRDIRLAEAWLRREIASMDK
jgi:RNA polymerase sigma factor (TIGR02999 family)